MPYYLHVTNADPVTGTAYAAKPEAIAARASGQSITFVASDLESAEWKAREAERFDGSTYQAVPWSTDPRLFEATNAHFAHLSRSQPGMIAYTPNDEYGVQNRKLRVRPGKYLADHVGEILSAVEIEAYTAQVRAQTGGFKIARTAEEITAVYVGGPQSCMSHRHDTGKCRHTDCRRNGDPVDVRADHKYRTGGVHPTAVYGISDLAVAYLGPIDAVSARCVIWPDRKQYSVVYGDSALGTSLDLAGYHYVSEFDGAKIRAISLRSGEYLMPWVDGASYATRDGDWFVLNRGSRRHTDRFETRNTNGVAGCSSTCDHCGTTCEYDETLCESCKESHWTCNSCGESSYDSDDSYGIDGDLYCESCSQDANTCEYCNETSFSDMTYIERNGVHACNYCFSRKFRTCDTCEEAYKISEYSACPDCPTCDTCGNTYAESDGACPDCPEETESEPAPAEPTATDTAESDVAVVNDGGTVPPAPVTVDPNPLRPFTTICVDGRTERVPVPVLMFVGPFALHYVWTRSGLDETQVTITHVQTGLQIGTRPSFDVAYANACALVANRSITWDIESRYAVPERTAEYARAVNAQFT